MPWKRVVIIGAGGRAREVAEILLHQARESNGPRVLGFVVDDPESHGAPAGRESAPEPAWYD